MWGVFTQGKSQEAPKRRVFQTPQKVLVRYPKNQRDAHANNQLGGQYGSKDCRYGC
jgi:hypothetical protein